MIRFLRVGIITAAVLIIVLEFFGAGDFIDSPYIGIDHHNLIISKIKEDGPNAGLPIKTGDKIVAVDGVIVRNINHYRYITYKNTDYSPFVFSVMRGDSLFNVKVTAVKQSSYQIFRQFVLMISGLTFILVGFIVILKRPDTMGVLFSLNCFIIAFLLTKRPVTASPLLHISGELIYDLFFIFLPATFLHFFLMFPGREIKTGTRRSKAEKFLYFPPALIYIASFILSLANYSSSVGSYIINTHETIASIYWVVYMVLCPVTFIRTYRTSPKALKTKFRIVTFGLAIGILPITFMILIMQFKPTLVSHEYHFIPGLTLSFISISFGYAILKHDAFNLRLVFRTGVIYIVLLLAFTGVYYGINETVRQDEAGGNVGIERYYFTILAVVFFAIIFVPLRSFIFGIVDRLFYKRKGGLGNEFIEFSHDIRLCKTFEGVVENVCEGIADIFNSECVLFFVRESASSYQLKYTFPHSKKIPLTNFHSDVELIRLAGKKDFPLMLEYFDNLWLNNNLDRISRELIHITQSSVVVPVSEEGEMLGFIIVGRKSSGGVYNSEDAELLNFMGERTAATMRNIELYRANVEKEELENELRIASTIQKRLLPKSPPPLEGASLGARIKPCKQVGGDFYDFFKLGPKVTALVISDIAGKGVPASFLMSTLQASLRAEANLDKPPSKVIYNLNNYMFEKSDSIRHATLFYSVYDEESGLLTYSNAGAVPPVIFKNDGTVRMLKRGGLVIGVAQDTNYLDGAVTMDPGDLMVAFTDGVVDQEDEDGNHFGLDNLLDYIHENFSLEIEDLMETLFQRLLAFGHEKMKDDMTVVMLRKAH